MAPCCFLIQAGLETELTNVKEKKKKSNQPTKQYKIPKSKSTLVPQPSSCLRIAVTQHLHQTLLPTSPSCIRGISDSISEHVHPGPQWPQACQQSTSPLGMSCLACHIPSLQPLGSLVVRHRLLFIPFSVTLHTLTPLKGIQELNLRTTRQDF